jgi:hypothetical protein
VLGFIELFSYAYTDIDVGTGLCKYICNMLLSSLPLSTFCFFCRQCPFYISILLLLLSSSFLVRIPQMSKTWDIWLFEISLSSLHDDLRFHPFFWKWHNFIFPFDWIVHHNMCLDIRVYVYIYQLS